MRLSPDCHLPARTSRSGGSITGSPREHKYLYRTDGVGNRCL
jgi:hypothetical protein